MLSCDTMAVAAKFSRYGQNMLAKNSDRPTAEAQKLVFFPAADYALEEEKDGGVQCPVSHGADRGAAE